MEEEGHLLGSSIVIDNGSNQMKIGFAGERRPRSIIASIIGRPKVAGLILGDDQKEIYVGEEALKKRGVLELEWTISNNKVVPNWGCISEVWKHVIENELHRHSTEHPILMTIPPLFPRVALEEYIQTAFETLSPPGLHLALAPRLALFHSGRTTGIVLSSGEHFTSSVPFIEGSPIYTSAHTIPIGGHTLTHSLLQQLAHDGLTLPPSAKRDIGNNLKEKLCFVAGDYKETCRESETSYIYEKKYELPDGSIIIMDKKRFCIPEIMFGEEYAYGSEYKYSGSKKSAGVTHMLGASFSSLPHDLQASDEFLSNILLEGGNTLFEGFPERIQMDLQSAFPTSRVRVLAEPERRFSVWLGGSILASLPAFQGIWITKPEYNEFGPAAVHRKYFY